MLNVRKPGYMWSLQGLGLGFPSKVGFVLVLKEVKWAKKKQRNHGVEKGKIKGTKVGIHRVCLDCRKLVSLAKSESIQKDRIREF